MPRERFHFLSMNQDFQPLHLRHIGFQSSRDGIHRQLLAYDSRRNGSRQRLGKIRDRRSVRQQIKRQQQRVRRQGAQLRVHGAREQRIQNLLRSHHGILRKGQLDRYRHQRGINRIRSPEEFRFHPRTTRIDRHGLPHFAPSLSPPLLLHP